MWIYQDQTNSLDILENKYGVHYWNDWEVNKSRTIGLRYGETVRKHKIINRLLDGLAKNPWNRRNIINLWQYDDFDKTEGLLPCAFLIMFDVRNKNNQMFLDSTLVQRSNAMFGAPY